MVGKRVEKISPKIGTNYNEFDKFQWEVEILKKLEIFTQDIGIK